MSSTPYSAALLASRDSIDKFIEARQQFARAVIAAATEFNYELTESLIHEYLNCAPHFEDAEPFTTSFYDAASFMIYVQGGLEYMRANYQKAMALAERSYKIIARHDSRGLSDKVTWADRRVDLYNLIACLKWFMAPELGSWLMTPEQICQGMHRASRRLMKEQAKNPSTSAKGTVLWTFSAYNVARMALNYAPELYDQVVDDAYELLGISWPKRDDPQLSGDPSTMHWAEPILLLEVEMYLGRLKRERLLDLFELGKLMSENFNGPRSRDRIEAQAANELPVLLARFEKMQAAKENAAGASPLLQPE